MRISDCSSDVCSSDLTTKEIFQRAKNQRAKLLAALVTRKLALNMRQLEIVTGIERSTICRRLTELQEGGKVKLEHYAMFPITKYPRVGFNTLVAGEIYTIWQKIGRT